MVIEGLIGVLLYYRRARLLDLMSSFNISCICRIGSTEQLEARWYTALHTPLVCLPFGVKFWWRIRTRISFDGRGRWAGGPSTIGWSIAYGHDIKDYFQLKKEIKVLIRQGYPWDFVNHFRDTEVSGCELQFMPKPLLDNRPIFGVIYTIARVSVARGESSFARKAYARVI